MNSTVGRKATPEMVRAANPPDGFEPIVSNSAFGWENGPIFEKLGGDSFTRGFRVASRHVNAGGIVHGGMIMTFADIVLARGVGSIVNGPFVTVRLTTDFIGMAIEGEWVTGTAKAELLQQGMVAVSGHIETEKHIVASMQGLFKVISSRN